MSAYMVEREVINYLLTAAMSRVIRGTTDAFRWQNGENRQELLPGDSIAATSVGQMLWDANRESINARYPDTIGHIERMPGVIDEDYIFEYIKDFRTPIDPVQVLKTCDCYEYQSCEYIGWENSQSHSFIQALRSDAWRALPGYEEAKWGAPEIYKVSVA